ncbi:hypothetical protein FOXG_19202 [Fusarium oxysporum f. sp. lycopersici 4287]|uniref:Uncharacterized protein n=1 Tax=Fusarium oxysporum f. sp. lycopersici (strain 4287 / CBS 123668 / FGSC 9935 / NRRL 34936) TaxID=426428 RepID=A0A0J9WLI6_FUSO4|nr:hypothetical protein FOXG_19202 [Fusarium oxysporum f. sp. lycopersici 4287]KNB03847.1 hypothetical protein FOXG_19202 [Fusarium oxysporum f. sp. lycopersici 4287]
MRLCSGLVQVSSLINLLTGNAMTLSVALAIDLVTITNLPSRLTFWKKPPADATSVPRSLHDVRPPAATLLEQALEAPRAAKREQIPWF